MSKAVVRIVIWSIVFGWMCLIFYLSAQEAAKSAATSNTVSEVVATIVYDDPTPSLVSRVDGFVRESAHFLIFTLLSFFMYVGLIRTKFAKHAVLLTVAACALYAVTDEVHQLFVMGRSFQLLDWALDFFGSVLGVLVGLLFTKAWSKLYGAKPLKNCSKKEEDTTA